MKKLLSILLLIFGPSLAYADDTDIYGVAEIDVKPNVMIIFDTSGSMGTQDVPADFYDPSETYTTSQINVCTGSNSAATQDVVSNAVYYKSSYVSGYYWWGGAITSECWSYYYDDISSSDWQCNDVKTDLTTQGYATGKTSLNSGVVSCNVNAVTRDYRLGNYANFISSSGGSGYKSRMVVAKEVVAKLIYDNREDVRFGLMRFNNNYGDDQGGYLLAPCGSEPTELIGSGYDPDTVVFTDSNQSGLGAVGNLYSNGYTPLAETMAESGLYFGGVQSWFNGGSVTPYGNYSNDCTSYNNNCSDYADIADASVQDSVIGQDTPSYTGSDAGDLTGSPIQYRCQKSFVIFMTDGAPTQDNHSKLGTRDYIIDGETIPAGANDLNTSNYLDDVTYFLAHNDLRPDLGETGDYADQTVTTYTIGFQTDVQLLQDAATNGNGEYYQANNASSLNEALSSIITRITENSQGFSAAAVPVSRANNAYSGDYVYYGLFQPLSSGRWIGNIKKYGISSSGGITDVNGDTVVSAGIMSDTAQSYWSTSIDGASVSRGGTGEKLFTDIENNVSRSIYTYLGTDPDLTATVNNFATSNATLQSLYTALTNSVISTVRHEDGTWPFSSFLHSQPLVINYDDKSVIYAGSNGGMLHAFDDVDGSELWGYIPTDLLGNLPTLETEDSLSYFVDGTATPYTYTYDHDSNASTDEIEKMLLIFGERRGGNSYTALDITDYTSPQFAYSINEDILVANSGEYLGQSWSTPQSVTMRVDEDTTKDVLFFSGGYDTNQDAFDPDDNSVIPNDEDTIGRAVFAVDATDGTLFERFGFYDDSTSTYSIFSNATFSEMTHSIIAANAFENPKSRNTTRVYAGDMNGNLFAFRDDIFHRNRYVDYKDSFGGLYDGLEDGKWEQKLKLFSTEGQKIFYAPNIVNEYFYVDFTYPPGELDATATVVRSEKRVGDYVFYGTGDRANPTRTDIQNGFYAIKNNWQWNSETPDIIKAYIDIDDSDYPGAIKAVADDSIIIYPIYVDDTGNEFTENPAGTYTFSDYAEASAYSYFLLNMTDGLHQSTASTYAERKLHAQYVVKAMDHDANRGWYRDFQELDGSWVGEKIVSTPVIYAGVIYFTTYVPEEETTTTDDPCASSGSSGTGYLWALGYEYGDSAIDFPDDDDSPEDDIPAEPDEGVEENDDPLDRGDRRTKLGGGGIPPQPVVVIQEEGATIATGYETTDPPEKNYVESFFWRQR